jgi:hypothetical protein
MPKLKQFQAIGDAAGWFVIGLDTGGALWYGTPTVHTPHQVAIAWTRVTEGGDAPTGAPRPSSLPRSPRGH